MSHVNFLGIPVEGDIQHPDKKTPQRPLSELEPLLRAVLDDPTIDSFGWTQYTPYFNDGDPCVFHVGEPWFRTKGDPAVKADSNDEDEDYDEDDDEEHGVGYGHPTLGNRDFDYVNGARVEKPYVGPDEARYDRCVALAEAVDSGAFDDVLLESFGDHCRVKVTSAGITVDEYSHS
jgi:hypothetical protein